jgi:predicted DNA-binding protein with PD1-like motif
LKGLAKSAIKVIAMKMANGKISDILAVRLQRGEEMLDGVKRVCLANGIKNAVILSMIGSLDGACYTDPIVDSSKQNGISGIDLQLEGPLEVLTAQGEICHHDNGDLLVHIHVTCADSKGVAYGGHIMGGGNKVLNTLNIFIGVIDGINMGIELDNTLGIPAFCPKNV